MEELYSIGFSDSEITDIINCNPDIRFCDKEEIINFIKLFRGIKCNDTDIKCIIYANPFCLNRSIDDIQRLILKFSLLGISDIKEVFVNNPFIIEKDDFEIDDYIVEKGNQGIDIDEILDNLSKGIME